MPCASPTSLDHIVLFSGDGDFRSLVAALQQMGKRVSVVSTLQTQPPMVADELRRQADQFIDLADLEQLICRDPAARVAGRRPCHRHAPARVAARTTPRARPAPSRTTTTSPKRSDQAARLAMGLHGADLGSAT